MAKNALTKMMVGSTAKAKTLSGLLGCRGSRRPAGAVRGVAEQAGDEAGDFGEDNLAVAPLDDREGEDDLQAETPDDGLPANGAPVGGECVGESEKSEKTEQTGKTCQGRAPINQAELRLGKCIGFRGRCGNKKNADGTHPKLLGWYTNSGRRIRIGLFACSGITALHAKSPKIAFSGTLLQRNKIKWKREQ
jgi:hypothetical protein